jgi:hypothetical protein
MFVTKSLQEQATKHTKCCQECLQPFPKFLKSTLNDILNQ